MRGSPSQVWRGAADPIYAGSNPAPRFKPNHIKKRITL